MATYLELATLANDSSFLLRIGYAIGKYAAYIFNESGGTTNHTERLNWALSATANIPLMQSLLVHEICRDSNVVAGLEAVSDVNLQTATETAANNRILAPISYADLNALANDNAFVRRIQIAVGRFASYVLNEDPGTPNHAPRYAWSRNAILNTLPIASALAPTIVMNSTVAAKLAGTSDAEIQSAVEVQIALLML